MPGIRTIHVKIEAKTKLIDLVLPVIIHRTQT